MLKTTSKASFATKDVANAGWKERNRPSEMVWVIVGREDHEHDHRHDAECSESAANEPRELC
eukprot:scaffold132923_cov37-Tisochrysis_lutea.AAC.2